MTFTKLQKFSKRRQRRQSPGFLTQMIEQKHGASLP